MSDRAIIVLARVVGALLVAAAVLALGRLFRVPDAAPVVRVVTACDPSTPAWLQIDKLRERVEAGAPLTDCDLDLIDELAEETVRCLERPDYYDVPICWDDLNRCEESCRTDHGMDEPTVWGDIVQRLDECQRSTTDERRAETGIL